MYSFKWNKEVQKAHYINNTYIVDIHIKKDKTSLNIKYMV